ncbi:TraB/GumN family protein [Oceaniserpentilla sp. 4NH20-0058]|uniref:TraB/GumN family protein n=1 Tax=Oceaniserpentilla sp. 4NH20-0058 TaxID=3127660 RepID=UPI00310A3BD8
MRNIYQYFIFLLISVYTGISLADVGPGLLWRIHKPQQPPSFLFGTIHIDDKRVKKLNAEVTQRFSEAKTLCLEILPDREMQVGIGRAMLLPDGQFLDEILGESLFNRLSLSLNKLGISPLEAAHLKPWAAMVVLSRPESHGGYALDEQLYHWGIHQYKKLCALETLQEQLSVFDNLSTSDQITLLTDSMDFLPVVQELNEKLVQAYLSGNLDEIYRRSMELQSKDDALTQRLMYALIDQRNHKMMERILPQLSNGRVFIAVGALHLPGKNGLINLLRQQGYAVTPPSLKVSPWE